MKLLAIDTATEACSAALWIDGEVSTRYQVAPRQHAKLILPMIEQLLAAAAIKPAQLDGLVLGRGPGSFTGVRIAAAAVQGIALATDCPVVPVSTLAAMAHRAYRECGIEHCIALIDARMSQVYWACFETKAIGGTRALSSEAVADPAAVTKQVLPATVPAVDWTGAGSGALAYVNELGITALPCVPTDAALLPSALDMLHLAQADFLAGNTVSAMDAVPVYLRDNVALTEKQRSDAQRG